MHLQDVWNSGVYDAVEMTTQVNKMPFKPGRIGQMGIYREFGITTTDVAIGEDDGKLGLVQTSERGSPPNKMTRNGRKIRKLQTAHLSEGFEVYPESVQNVMEFGAEGQMSLRTMEAERDEYLQQGIDKIDATIENLMLGGVMGKLYDADGTVIYDLFEEFGITEPAAVDLDLDGTPNIIATSHAVKRRIARGLKVNVGDYNIAALCGDALFDSLITQKEIREAYLRYQESQFNRTGHAFSEFMYGGILWMNYRGFDFDVGDTAPDTTQGTGLGINADDAHFFPLGVPGLFECPYAPADWVSAANTRGLPRYAGAQLGPQPGPLAKYIEGEVQSNPLPYCTRPAALVKGTRT